MALTMARVDMKTPDNGTWQDAFQFGTVGDTTWDFVGVSFHMDVKGSSDDASALISLTTGNGRIVIDDAVQRVLHLNVTQTDLEAALVPGKYVYDLVMLDTSVPPIRTPLMEGYVVVKHGVTQS